MPRTMRRSLLACGLLLAGALVLFRTGVLAQRAPLVIEGGTLIDGRGGAPVDNAVVVIEGNKISAVGQKGAVTYPQGARIISATGKYVLPGFIDNHVHWAEWVPELYLAHGVTSGIELNPRDWHYQVKQALAAHRMAGPRLFLSTPHMYGRLSWNAHRSIEFDDAAMVRKVTKGFGPGRSRYSLAKVYTEVTYDELQAIVEENHAAGRRVIGHIGSLDAREVAEIGMDAVSHSTGIAMATIADPVKVRELEAFARLGTGVYQPLFLVYHAYMDPKMSDDLAAYMARKHVRIEPNVLLIARYVSKHLGEFEAENAKVGQDPNLAYVGEARLRGYSNLHQQATRLTPEQRQLMVRGFDNLKRFYRKFAEDGGMILAGCDCTPAGIPGLGLHQEMEMMVEAGFTPMQVIQAATRNEADLLQESELGTVEPGKLADVLVLRQNPLTDIHNTRSIDVVIQDGAVLDTHYHANYVNPVPGPENVSQLIAPSGNGPFVREVDPMGIRPPTGDVQLLIAGSNFSDTSIVQFDGVTVPATPVKTSMLPETAGSPIYTELSATVPRDVLKKIGTYKVIVKSPNGAASNVGKFFVAPPPATD